MYFLLHYRANATDLFQIISLLSCRIESSYATNQAVDFHLLDCGIAWRNFCRRLMNDRNRWIFCRVVNMIYVASMFSAKVFVLFARRLQNCFEDRKSTRLTPVTSASRMPSSA